MNRSAPISALKRVLHVLDELGKDSLGSSEDDSPLHHGGSRTAPSCALKRVTVYSVFR